MRLCLGPPDLKVAKPELADIWRPSGERKIRIRWVMGNGTGIGSGTGGGLGAGRKTAVRAAERFARGVNGVGVPKCYYQPDPPYSEEARKAKYQGIVVVEAIIENGRPRDEYPGL